MSATIKLQLSRMAIFSVATVLVFSILTTAAIAQGIAGMDETARTVADMNAMQLLAYIALASIGALVVVIGFYVKSVSAFQKEIAASLATITTALNDVAKTCQTKRCP